MKDNRSGQQGGGGLEKDGQKDNERRRKRQMGGMVWRRWVCVGWESYSTERGFAWGGNHIAQSMSLCGV